MVTSVASGVGGYLGVAAESAYNTFVPPDHFIMANSESLALVKNTAQGSGFANGQLLDPSARRVITSTAGAGTVGFDVVSRGLGLLLKQVFGTGVQAVVSGSVNSQTFTLADLLGVFFSAQVGIPDLATGTVHPYSFGGGKCTSFELSCAQNAILTASMDMDFASLSEVPAVATPSYVAAANEFHFAQMGVKIGAIGAEAAIQGVRGVTCKIDRNMDTGRFYANNAGVKAEPVTNAKVGVTGTLTTDYVTKADLYDRYPSDAMFSLILSWTGTVQIGTALFATLTVNLPNCFLDTDSPQIAGLDVISGDLNFTCLTDSTHVPTAVLQTLDTAL